MTFELIYNKQTTDVLQLKKLNIRRIITYLDFEIDACGLKTPPNTTFYVSLFRYRPLPKYLLVPFQKANCTRKGHHFVVFILLFAPKCNLLCVLFIMVK